MRGDAWRAPWLPACPCGAALQVPGPAGAQCANGHVANYNAKLAGEPGRHLVWPEHVARRGRAAEPPKAAPRPELNSSFSFNSYQKTAEQEWPAPPAPEAFYGLAGDVVAVVKGHTEADAAAVLVQFLAGVANAIGPRPHMLVGATRHGPRLNVAVVGKTARARKGDSWQFAWSLISGADEEWAGARVTTGLSTGEGLINAVADAAESETPAPITDRRLLVIETEFGRTLRVMARDGNTLSAVLRDAWDGRDLRVLTRGTPLRATAAHIGVIAHITIDELRRELSSTDAHNGFANRFLWVCARRSALLPDPLPVPIEQAARLTTRLRSALAAARTIDGVLRDEATRAAWTALYPTLTEEHDGLAGDVLARSEAQVLRLSMVYALLDGSKLIRPPHLLAAVALWDYCAASVAHIFGDASGDAVADELLKYLQAAGEATRTEISNYLGRNVPARRIQLALDDLKRKGLVARRQESTSGRPAELWQATGTPRRRLAPLLPVLRQHLSQYELNEKDELSRGCHPLGTAAAPVGVN